ncbi:DUF4422 domain-containing protein [Candidatus Pelagibacter communis]|uniref:DUF4422 domain-containing protein n=1 Tax=Pelagibacter ubique TaxID=198252 RepID=UPI00094CDAAE|nr:DUF4422 domain-containing protein [Candidatus Pelagibacter ubique]
MSKIKIFCVTNQKKKYLENLGLELVGVGRNNFSKKYINCLSGKNIQYKEKNYSELTFHYWFWKNKLKKHKEDEWIGFCQKRRFFVKKKIRIKNLKMLKDNLLKEIPKKWKNYESLICKPINIDNPKRMKLIKRGWKNILKDPTIFVDKKKQNILLNFDMNHGFGVLDKAINVLGKEDREDFRKFVSKRTRFNPHIMMISKKKILSRWFKNVFDWLFKCEKIFGLKQLKGYDQQRLYAYLAERYLSFWFSKYTKHHECDWVFFEEK